MKKNLVLITSIMLLSLQNISLANSDNILKNKNYINVLSPDDNIRNLNRYEKSILKNINTLAWTKIPNNLALLYFWNVENYNSDSLYSLVDKWIELSEKANNNYSNLSLVYLSLIKLDYDNAIKYIEKVKDNDDIQFLKDLANTLIGKLEGRKSFHTNSPQSSYIYYKTRVVQRDDVEALKKKYSDNPLTYYLSAILFQNQISNINIENNKELYEQYSKQMIEDINKAVNLDSDNLLFLLKKYELEYINGNIDNNVFERIYELSLKDDLISEIIGNIYARNNQIDLSIEFLEKSLEKKPKNLGLYKKLSSLYSYKQDNNSLIEVYKKGISNIPDNFELYVQLAEEYKKLNKKSKIIELYRNYLKVNPNSDEAYNLIGELLQEDSLFNDAIENYIKAISINNKNTKAYNNLILAYMDIKDYDNMIKYSIEAIENNSNYLLGYIWLSNGYLYKKETNKAIETLNKVIKINPDFSQAYLALGIVYNSINEYDKAINNFEKSLSKKDDINTKLYLAEAYHKKGDNSKAEEIYKDLSAQNPYDENIFFSLGNFYSDISKYTEAERAFEKAILINPKFFDARNNLGNVYIKSGKIDKALFEFEKIIKINPNYSTAYYNIACVYSLKNDKYKALKFLEQSIQMDKSLKEVARNDSDFENIKNESKFKELIK